MSLRDPCGAPPRMASGNPYVRKKAALCAMRIVRKVDEIEDKFNNKIGNLLEDSKHRFNVKGHRG